MIVYKEKKIGKGTFADKAKKGLKGLGEAIWFQMGEKEIYLEKESQKRCLVGGFLRLGAKTTNSEEMSSSQLAIERES